VRCSQAEGSDAGAAWLNLAIHATQAARRGALAAAYAELSAAKVPNLHYVKGEDLIGKSGATDLPTAMGTHPTDLGHHMIAAYYSKALPPILSGADQSLTINETSFCGAFSDQRGGDHLPTQARDTHKETENWKYSNAFVAGDAVPIAAGELLAERTAQAALLPAPLPASQVRKIVLFAPFLSKNRTIAKTGSGQT
jgi:hypothetical protein